MKKALFSISFLTVAQLSFGQISIDSSNLVNANQTIYLTSPSVAAINAVDVSGTGANQTWDLSALDSLYSDTLAFLNPNQGLFSNEYPNAALALIDEDGATNYFYKDANGFGFLGLVDLEGGDTIKLHFQQPFINFPCNYNNTIDETSVDSFTIPSQGIKLVFKIKTNSIIDGWGTLKLPKGDFDVLRQSQEITQYMDYYYDMGGGNYLYIDSDTGIDQSVVFWTNNEAAKFALVSVDYDSDLGTIDDISYLNDAPANLFDTTSIAPLPLDGLTLSPNPAKDRLSFQLPTPGLYQLVVSDLSGRELTRQQFQGSQYRLSVEGLSSGVYFYHIINRQTGATAVGKFIKE